MGQPGSRNPGPLLEDGGSIWIGESGRIAKLAPDGDYSEYSVPGGSYIDSLAMGPQGSVWFTLAKTNQMAVFRGERMRSYTLPRGIYPSAIGVTSNGIVWVGGLGGLVGWSATQGYKHVDRRNTGIVALIVDHDSSVWFTQGGSSVTRLTEHGELSPVLVDRATSQVVSLSLGSKGTIWYADAQDNEVGIISTTRLATIKMWHTKASPRDLASSPDGSMWFTEPDSQIVGHISESGHFTEYSIPVSFTDLTVDKSGTVWLAASPDLVARITTNGQLNYYSVFAPIRCQ